MKLQLQLYSLVLVLLSSLNLQAQEDTPDWQWAKRGGNITGLTGSEIYSTGMERVLEVVVDTENNYYFLAEVGSNQTDYDGMPLTTYSTSGQRKDIYVFSTDCEGNFRWDKMIGGGGSDFANSIGLDGNDNVYVSGHVINSNGTPPPPRFDTDSIKGPAYSQAGAMLKNVFIIKYDQDGNYQWLREPEGALSGPNGAQNNRSIIEADGTSHHLIRFREGTHLNGQLTVPDGELQSAMVVYDADGNLDFFFTLEMETGGFYDYQMVYDANLNRYYIADTKRNPTDEISIDGYGVASGSDKAFYLAALDDQGQVIWYHENQFPYSYSIGDIKLDTNGDVYFTGQYTGDGLLDSNLEFTPDSFAGFEFMTGSMEEPKGPFLVKLDSDGNLIWGTNAIEYSRFPGRSIAIDGDDVYLGLGILGNTWDGVNVPGPELQGLVPDPSIIRFDAASGDVEDVISMPQTSSYQDAFMSIAVDGYGNIISGGYFGGSLLNNHPAGPLNNIGGDSDFFIAQYGTGNCSETASSEDFGKIKLNIHPNPTSGLVTISYKHELSTYKVYDLQGKVLQSGRLKQQQINLSQLQAGLYLLSLTDINGQQSYVKVVKE
ncbi:MAG: T9SS type A sorting domain-containing protein [Psychroflexus salarius]